MNFGLNEEQRLFRDSVMRYLADEFPFERRQKLIAAGEGLPRGMWPAIADLGWLAAPFAEEHGGLGGGAVELSIVMEQLGRSLCVTPYLATVVLAGVCLREGGTTAHKETVLPAIAQGETKLSFAHGETRGRHARAHVQTTARRQGDAYVLDGAKAVVPFAGEAEMLVVSARSSGDDGDEEGLSLCLVPSDAQGLSRIDFDTQDGGRASDVTLSGVTVGADALIGREGGGFELIDLALDWGAAMVCAESVGAMWVIHEMTLEYLKTRSQFGAALSTFQALQHRMVDMYMHCELAQSMAMDAVAALERDDVTERRLAVSAAKVQVGRLGRSVGQEGIQLHGGIGMTMDVPIGHYFKRLTMAGLTFGDIDTHLNRMAALQAREMHNLQQAG
jgi:alkylation response protein AidB-like acyl-CoA dehydrogenase